MTRDLLGDFHELVVGDVYGHHVLTTLVCISLPLCWPTLRRGALADCFCCNDAAAKLTVGAARSGEMGKRRKAEKNSLSDFLKRQVWWVAVVEVKRVRGKDGFMYSASAR